MKKFMAVLLAAVLALSLAACGSKQEPAPSGDDIPAAQFAVAMVTDYGDITDESFNQATYEECKDFCEANDLKYTVYKPGGDSTADRVKMIEDAISDGYNVIVTPGYAFAGALEETATKYPDVKFIALDVSEEAFSADYQIPENLFSAVYQEELSGYMAGYAAVALGYRTLGFLGGMAFPSVIRFGYGFVQGCNDAAVAAGAEDVVVEYVYANQFFGDASVTDYMDKWYQENNVEVVFAAGGGVWTSVGEAAAKAGGKVIGVEVDQANVINAYGEDMTVTSAMKDLKTTVNTLLTALIIEDDWASYGGQIMTLGLVSGTDIEANYVQLPYESTQWNDSFTQEDYAELVGMLYDGTLTVSNDIKNEPEVTITVNYNGNIK